MIKLTTAALFFLAAGILTSVTILAGFQILFGISVIYYTYVALREKNFKLPPSAWCLIIFSAVATLSLFINYELVAKFMKHFSRIKYYLYGALGILVLRVWIKESTDKTKAIIYNTFLLSFVVCGLYTIYELTILGRDRAWGLTETMRYGYSSAYGLLLVLGTILHHKKLPWVNLKFTILAFALGFFGMYVTYTRGALLGFLCGLPFVLYYYKPKLGLTLGSLAVLGVLTLGGFYLFGSGNYESRFLANSQNGSDQIRRSQWIAGLIAVKERPVLGWGLDNFTSQRERIKHANNLHEPDYNGHTHNQFLEILAGTGFIGFAFFLGWVVLWAREIFKSNNQILKGLIIPIGVAFVISSQFEATLNANISSMVFAIYSLSMAISERRS